MIGHKLRIAVWLMLSIAGTPVIAAETVPVPEAPSISETHRAYLSRAARRSVLDAFSKETPYVPEYVPQGLTSLPVEAIVRVRQSGYLLGAGAGDVGPVADSVCVAADRAARTFARESGFTRDDVADLLIEIEVVGPATALPEGIDWTRPGAVDRYVELGLDGIAVRAGERTPRLCPTEMFTSDMPLADALKLLAQSMRLGPDQVARTPLLRFRTAHWYEARAGTQVVSLRRGLTQVSADAVSPSGLKEAIDRIGAYMMYRQRDSGLFAYQFEPGADRYSAEDNAVRQAGAALGMAVYARWSGGSGARAAADAAIAYHLQRQTDFPSADNAAFIAAADGKNKLGVTALLALALADHPDAAVYDDVRRRLLRGILGLQRPSGMFMTAFPPAVDVAGQDYFPGEALFALAEDYDRQPSAEILQAFDRAIAFYRDYFEASRSPAFVPWQVQAFARMAKHTKRADYVEYVFSLTDYLAAKQLTAENCPWAEMHGGIAGYTEGRAGVATASYLEGFADALLLARRVRDAERVARYEKLVRGAARFVMQLEFRPEEAFFVRSPVDVVGGIRTAPALNKLRIDHCQHALIALIKAREALFPSEG